MTYPVVDDPDRTVSHGSLDAATSIMTAHDDVFNFKDIDGIVKDAEHVHIRMNNHIGNISVNKYFPGGSTNDFIGRNPAVRASDPQ